MIQTDLAYSTSNQKGGHSWGTFKQHMKLQQPRSYDFRVSQFNLPGPKVVATVKWRLSTWPSSRGKNWYSQTTANLQQLGANSRKILVAEIPPPPPYRETGVAILCRTVFPVVSQTFAATPPKLPTAIQDRPWRGGIAEKACLSRQRASHEIVSLIAL